MNQKKAKKIIVCTLDDSYKWFKSENWLRFIDSEKETIIIIKGGPYTFKNKTLCTMEKQMKNLSNVTFVSLQDGDDISKKILDAITQRIEDDLYVCFANNEPLYIDMKPELEKIYAGVYYNKEVDFREIDRKNQKRTSGSNMDFSFSDAVSSIASESEEPKKDKGNYEKKSFEHNDTISDMPEKKSGPNMLHKDMAEQSDDTTPNGNSDEEDGETNHFHKTKKKLSPKVFNNSDAGEKMREIEKKIFEKKLSVEEFSISKTKLSDAKANLISELQLRCIQDIDYMFKGIETMNLTFEQYIKVINLIILTDNAESLKENLCSTFSVPEKKLSISKDAYIYIKSEMEYYKKVCNLMYQCDQWDR